MALLWPDAEVFRAVLPEMLVNGELRELYHQQVLIPTFQVAERYFLTQRQEGHMRQIDIPLTARAIAAMLLGLLTMQLLGDETIATRWEELPEVLATMILDGLLPHENAQEP